MASALAFSYAQFNERLYIGSPFSPNTVSTGELDVGIWCWMGKVWIVPFEEAAPYMSIDPAVKFWGYDNAVKTVEFEVNNAYPGAYVYGFLWIRNTGTIAANVSDITWDLPDYVSVHYWGGEIPDWLAENLTELVEELYESGEIDEFYYNEMIKTINERVNSGCLHEGLTLDAGKNDINIVTGHSKTFKDDTQFN